jgi:YHS domain-containing protein
VAARVKDPVCGMEVDPAKARNAEYSGRTYYFCSDVCKSSFLQSPEKYTSQPLK